MGSICGERSITLAAEDNGHGAMTDLQLGLQRSVGEVVVVIKRAD